MSAGEAWDNAWIAAANVFDTLGAETITFTPRNGTAYSLLALVDRNPPVAAEGAGKILRPAFVVDCKNATNTGVVATAGVDITSTSLIGGYFTVARRKGTAETLRLTVTHESIDNHNAGRIKFAFNG